MTKNLENYKKGDILFAMSLNVAGWALNKNSCPYWSLVRTQSSKPQAVLSTTAQQHNSTTAQQHNSTTAQQHNSTTAQLYTAPKKYYNQPIATILQKNAVRPFRPRTARKDIMAAIRPPGSVLAFLAKHWK